MPRRSRVVIPGVPHHVTQRGNNRQPVFFCASDYRRYLEIVASHAARVGLRILGYCLMTNHVHLIAAPEHENSLGLALGRAHALALNRAYARTGHVWQNRFFSCPMSDSHLLAALRYVELNPVRAGLAAGACEWPWSSARAHATEAHDSVLHSGWRDHLGQWDPREWAEILAAGSGAGECEAVRRATWKGEPLGPRDFVRALERRTGKRLLVGERGRPNKKPAPEDRSEQGLLFAASQ